MEKGRRRFEEFRDLLVNKMILLEVLAKRCAGKPPEEWIFYFPPTAEVRFSDDPTVFRHAWWRNAVEAYLHRLDQEHQTFLSELKKAVVNYFGLELCIEINPQNASVVPDGAVYNEKKGVYRIVVKP